MIKLKNVKEWYPVIEYSPWLIIDWTLAEYKYRGLKDLKFKETYESLTEELSTALYNYLLHVCTRESLQWDGLQAIYISESLSDYANQINEFCKENNITDPEEKVLYLLEGLDTDWGVYYFTLEDVIEAGEITIVPPNSEYGATITMYFDEIIYEFSEYVNLIMKKIFNDSHNLFTSYTSKDIEELIRYISKNDGYYHMDMYGTIRYYAEGFSSETGWEFLHCSFLSYGSEVYDILKHVFLNVFKGDLELISELGDKLIFAWKPSYGGPAWAQACKICLNYYTGHYSDAIFIDSVLDLQHNNAYIINKTCVTSSIVYKSIYRTILDLRRRGDIPGLIGIREHLDKEYFSAWAEE